MRWIGDLPGGVAPDAVTGLEMRTTFTPDEGGEHTFAVSGFGTFELSVGDRRHRTSGTLHPAGAGRAELLLSPREHRAIVPLTAGVPVEVVLTPDHRARPGAHGLHHAGPSPARARTPTA